MAETQFRVRGELRLKNGRLVRLREQFGMNVHQFAEHVGITYGTYCGYETMRLYPGPAHAKKLAALAGCTAAELFPADIACFVKDEAPRVLVSDMEIPPERLLTIGRRGVMSLPSPDPGPDELLDKAALRAAIEKGLTKAVPPHVAHAIRMRYGIGTDREHTLEEIGAEIGVSHERAAQLIRGGVRRLARYSAVIRDFGPSEKNRKGGAW